MSSKLKLLSPNIMCSVMYLPGQVGDSVCVGQRSGDGGEERVLLFLQVSYLGVTYQSG